MKQYLRLSWFSSFTSLGVAICCVLPMAMLLLGLGGSWLAVFGKIAAASYYVLAASSAAIALAWVAAIRRGSAARLRLWLAGSTLLTVLAWLIALNEAGINDYLMTWM
ncbi:hypothetical protein ACUXV3_08455 [Roseobacteraceae bacterium NS-SX3]